MTRHKFSIALILALAWIAAYSAGVTITEQRYKAVPVTSDSVLIPAERLLPVYHPLDEKEIQFRLAGDVWVWCDRSPMNNGEPYRGHEKPSDYDVLEAWRCWQSRADPDHPNPHVSRYPRE